jgi:predicted DNA-binding protein with PD1-like motif
MRVNELGREGRGHASVLVFDTDDEVITTLEAHARRTGIKAAHFTALGAFRAATLAYFDWETKEYQEIPVDEQVEVTSLVGDIGTHEGGPAIHVHCVLGRRDGSPITGHLLEGHVRPTLELFLTAFDDELVRKTDEETGLPLIR